MKKTIVIMTMLAMVATVSSARAAVGIWTFDGAGTAVDSLVDNTGTAGDTLDGAVKVNPLTKVTGYDGTTNGAYSGFTGGRNVTIPYDDILNVNGSYIGVDCYIKVDDPSVDYGTNFIATRMRFGVSCYSNWRLGLVEYAADVDDDGHDEAFYKLNIRTWNVAGAGFRGFQSEYDIIAADWDPDAWYHVGFKLSNPTGNAATTTLYFGTGTSLTQVDTDTELNFTQTDVTGDTDLYIGTQGDRIDRYFKGSIDQVTFTPEPATMTLLLLGLPLAL
ncbi:MAG: hypothetical protein K8S55_07705, partial [Phycisphaerae bacterium]|nr:hypothetical protein [Phycisphaerae bacterium]